MITFSGLAFADWNANIHVKGQQIKGQFKSIVTIGVADAEKQTPAPPKSTQLFQFYCVNFIASMDTISGERYPRSRYGIVYVGYCC
jgi:hypothetical protein